MVVKLRRKKIELRGLILTYSYIVGQDLPHRQCSLKGAKLCKCTVQYY